MKENNIWSSIKFDKDSPNLLWVLKRQAEMLAEKTDGILYAEVNPIDAYDEKTAELGIVYNFYVCAPFLGNIRTLVFTVVELKDKIILIDRIGGAEKKEVKLILELIKEIENLMTSPEIQQQVSNLFSSSMEIKSLNRKSRRPGEEWAKIIERDFFVTQFPQSTKVELTTGKILEGYFQTFDDWILLKSKLKFRFVEWNKAASMRAEYDETKKLNPIHSIIIDCSDVKNIELTISPKF